MILPVWKQLTYISPSTFIAWRNCEFKIYLTRLAGLEFMPRVQGLAAAIGSVFDIFVKDYIAKKLNLKSPVLNLNKALKNSVVEEHRDEAISIGRNVATIYLKDLKLADEFIGSNEIYLEQELFKQRAGIPILGRIDMIRNNIPFDWKTRGFTSKNGAYPINGYTHKIKFDIKTKTQVKITNLDFKPTFLDEINENWAIGLLFYNWLLDNRPDKPYEIHEICKHGDYIEFAFHKGFISPQFTKKISDELEVMWDAITSQMYNATIDEPVPTNRRCMPYGILCEAAIHCKFYENYRAHEKMKGYFN